MIKSVKKVLFTVSLVVISVMASAQTMDNIVASLRAGNAAELAQYFQPNVEISLQENANSYSKPKAQQVLNEFFSKNTVRSFTVVHQGTSPEGAKFVIGTLATTNQTYRVYLYAVNNSGKLYVRELRFEQQ